MKKLISAFALFIGILASGQNPYLPLWEHLPDGEPRVFEDPDNAGHYRIYIIGSHDVRFGSYCGPDIREWSAPVENPSDWRDEGPIFTYQVDGQWDVMYAPDLVEIPQKDGSKVYYLYPHSRGAGREAMVCKGTRPDGPFTPVNLTEDGRGTLEGSTFGFDPSVFIEPVTNRKDPDYAIGFRAYGYWGFQQSSAAQIDQNTMYSVRPGTEKVPYFIPASFTYGNLRPVRDGAKFAVYEGEDLGDFNFFEASSIRQIGNKYVWVFSGHSGPDYGLPSSNSTLRYAYSDSPMGPWKSGGVLVDSRAIVLGENGESLYEGYSGHNTHGSLQLVGKQWYVFYHRAPRGFGFARQAMVAPVTVQWDRKPVSEGGAVRIYGYDPYTKDHVLTVKDKNGHEYKGAEVTSEGFSILGLDPYKYYSAGYACFLTNKESQQDSWDVWDNAMDITNVRNGDVIGYKYFNFDKLNDAQFKLFLTPKSTQDVTVEVLMDSPYSDAVKLGEILIPAGTDKEVFCLELGQNVDKLKKKHAIYLKAAGEARGNLFDLHGLGFCKKGTKLDRPVPPAVDIKANGVSLAIPAIPTRSTEKNGYVSQDIYDIETYQEGEVNLEVVANSTDVDIDIAPNENGLSVVKCTYKGKTKTFNIRIVRPSDLLKGHTRNLFAEYGYPEDEIENKLQDIFDEVFRGPNKVYFEVGDSLGYISDIKNHDVRTEGMSYGLMLAVQFGEKDIFDRLWRWSKKYMQHKEGPMKGYFAWSLNTDGTHRAEGPASDGELYFITSLIFASNLWGNDGDINYLAEAQYILNCAFSKNGEGGIRNFINEDNHLIVFTPDGFGTNYTDPSYHLPAFYEVWARYARDGRADFYLQCAKASREYMHRSINPRTGLNPDTNGFDGQPISMFGRFGGRRAPKPSFRYDSWRVPMNMALDYTWSGEDKQWKTWYANTIQRFFYSKGIDTFVDQYSTDGTDVEGIMPAGNGEMQVQALRHSVGLVATLAAVSLAADNDISKEFVDRLWNSKNEPYEDGYFDAYYDGILRLFAFMHLSGHYIPIGK